ncbi:hypothetical protein SBV1_1620022 [Verrucomicrobia bacterium]|nr:hypothetical protein SBV1_1620022 [Verrucomicrobiota bacterium]
MLLLFLLWPEGLVLVFVWRTNLPAVNQCEIPGRKGQFIFWTGAQTVNRRLLTRNQAAGG